MLYSHVLFFALDKASEKYTEQPQDVTLLIDFRNNFCDGISFGLQDFPLYGSRLHYIQKRMNEWRPQRFAELRVRPYKDPVAYYTFWFAAYFGLLGVLGLCLTIVQTYAALRSIP